MEWRKCVEPKALSLLGYMVLTYLYIQAGHLEIALTHALIVCAHLNATSYVAAF